MANCIRTEKSARDWTTYELQAYNIAIKSQSKEEFFGTEDLSVPEHLEDFLTTEHRTDATNPQTKRLIYFLDLAMDPSLAMVNSFVLLLLERLGYDNDVQAQPRIIDFQPEIDFVVCGEYCLARADLCVMDDKEMVVLLVQNDKTLPPSPHTDSEAKAIANAIATFSYNNKTRENRNLSPLPSMMLPAIMMTGTFPRFYKIMITSELGQAVEEGVYPRTTTEVLRFTPQLPLHLEEGMRPLGNRLEILKYMEAFKKFIPKLSD